MPKKTCIGPKNEVFNRPLSKIVSEEYYKKSKHKAEFIICHFENMLQNDLHTCKKINKNICDFQTAIYKHMKENVYSSTSNI